MMEAGQKSQHTDFLAALAALEAAGEAGTSGLLESADFTVDVRVANGVHKPREHICGADEFTYVLRGTVTMRVEGTDTAVQAGQGFLVKAGIRHNTLPEPGAAWLLIARPHKHVYFE